MVAVVTKRGKMKSRSNECNIDFSNRDLLINPGNKYTLRVDDVCIYISLNSEDSFDFKDAKHSNGFINFN